MLLLRLMHRHVVEAMIKNDGPERRSIRGSKQGSKARSKTMVRSDGQKQCSKAIVKSDGQKQCSKAIVRSDGQKQCSKAIVKSGGQKQNSKAMDSLLYHTH